MKNKPSVSKQTYLPPKLKPWSNLASSLIFFSSMAWGEARTLDLEVLKPKRSYRAALPSVLPNLDGSVHSSSLPNSEQQQVKSQERPKSVKAVRLSQLWKRIKQQLNDDFFSTLAPNKELENLVLLLEDEDFLLAKLPLLSPKIKTFKNLPKAISKSLTLSADIAGLETFISKQSPERQAELVSRWRGMILDQCISYMRHLNGRPKTWKGLLYSKITHDSNINKRPDTFSGPAQHSGKSDLQALFFAQGQYTPQGKWKKFKPTIKTSIFQLAHDKYSENDITGLSFTPQAKKTFNHRIFKSIQVGHPFQYMQLSNGQNGNKASLRWGPQLKAFLSPVDLGFEQWGEIIVSLEIAKQWKTHLKSSDQNLDLDEEKVSVPWKISLPHDMSLNFIHSASKVSGEQNHLNRNQWFNKCQLERKFSESPWIQSGALGWSSLQNTYSEFFGGTQKEISKEWFLELRKKISDISFNIKLSMGDKQQILDPDFLDPITQNISYTKFSLGAAYAF
jgi:hypothetical protein